MIDDYTSIGTKQELKLRIELIINRKLYNNNKIHKETFSRVEQNILKDLKREKMK